jgi:hypothetical protein
VGGTVKPRRRSHFSTSLKHVENVQTTTPPSQEKKVEVVGDRVRCDVRFTELGFITLRIQVIFDKCVGSAAASD